MKLIGNDKTGVIAAKQDWTLSLVDIILAYVRLLCILIRPVELQRRTNRLLIRWRVWRSIEVACRVWIMLSARRRSVRLVRRGTHLGCCCGS